MLDVDCLVVGAGVIGLAAARAMQLAGYETFVIDREGHFGTGTSSRNSEVIHAGIYYPRNSLKAVHCVRGREMLYSYCADRHVPHRRLGKLIVAVRDDEVAKLDAYKQSAEANGVTDLHYQSHAQLNELEPSIYGVAGLLSPSTGIVDSHAFMLALLQDLESTGGHFVRECAFERARATPDGRMIAYLSDETVVRTKWLINAAGLHAPEIAKVIEGLDSQFVPTPRYAIGHYYSLTGKSPFRRLVYPIAVAGGLGVHVTLDMAGNAKFGPDIRWTDELDYSFDDSRRSDFLAAIRAYYPGIADDSLVPGYTGIRPKIVGPGQPDADFVIQATKEHGLPGLVNLFGIESPGLTASLSIAAEIANLSRATN